MIQEIILLSKGKVCNLKLSANTTNNTIAHFIRNYSSEKEKCADRFQ